MFSFKTGQKVIEKPETLDKSGLTDRTFHFELD
jgi:hypothetical protein